MATLREANSDLFARLLTEEYQIWLIAAAPELPTSDAPCCDLGPPNGTERNAPGRQEQAIIGELGLGDDDGGQMATGVVDLAVWRMLRQARLSISSPPAEGPRDTP
ncbi:MAG TPA: hypothetical protein VF933_27915 [Streptosporangiaceae bacterium]